MCWSTSYVQFQLLLHLKMIGPTSTIYLSFFSFNSLVYHLRIKLLPCMFVFCCCFCFFIYVVSVFVTYRSKMSCLKHVTGITVIIIFLFIMEPPYSIAANLWPFDDIHVQVPRVLLAMLKQVVFCQIISPVLCLFLKAHRPRDSRNLEQFKIFY